MPLLKKVVVVLMFVLSSLPVYATTQAGDILIMGKDTSALFAFPLESYPQFKNIAGHLFGIQQTSTNTSCWRGYIAEWTVIKQKLYLTHIYSCDGRNGIKADLKKLFKAQCINGKVKAGWVTGDLWVPEGKLIHYNLNGGWPAYSKELKLVVERGLVKDTMHYNYPDAVETPYAEHMDSLQKFIYQHMDWQKVPILTDHEERIVATFITGPSIHPDSVKVAKESKAYPILNEEALRVMRLVTWGVYYQGGKVLRERWSVPIVFNEENRKKYLQRR